MLCYPVARYTSVPIKILVYTLQFYLCGLRVSHGDVICRDLTLCGLIELFGDRSCLHV
jgi:hypothetical protein